MTTTSIDDILNTSVGFTNSLFLFESGCVRVLCPATELHIGYVRLADGVRIDERSGHGYVMVNGAPRYISAYIYTILVDVYGLRVRVDPV